MPDVFTELMEIDEVLHTAMIQATSQLPVAIDSGFVTEEAQKILKDASIVAEQRIKEHFPELPTFERVGEGEIRSSSPGENSR